MPSEAENARGAKIAAEKMNKVPYDRTDEHVYFAGLCDVRFSRASAREIEIGDAHDRYIVLVAPVQFGPLQVSPSTKGDVLIKNETMIARTCTSARSIHEKRIQNTTVFSLTAPDLRNSAN